MFHQLTNYERDLLNESLPDIHKANNDSLKVLLLHEMYEKFNDNDVWVMYMELMNDLAENGSIKSLTPDFYVEIKSTYYNDWSYYHNYKGRWDLAIKQHLLHLKLLKEKQRFSSFAEQLYLMSNHFQIHGDMERAIELNLKSIKLSELLNDSCVLVWGHNSIGLKYKVMGNQIKTLENYNQALKYHKEDCGLGIKGSLLNNIGIINGLMGEDSTALKYYQQGLELFKETGNIKQQAILGNNIAKLYLNNKKYNEALILFQKSYDLNTQINNVIAIPSNLSYLAICHNKMGEFDQAREYSKKSYEMIKNTAYKKEKIIVSIIYAKTLINSNPHLAEKILMETLENSKKNYFLDQIKESYAVLTDLYREEGKGMKAINVMDKYIVLKDSLMNADVSKKLIKQHSQYEYEKQKTLDDMENDKLLAVEEGKRAKQKIIAGASIGLLIMVGMFLILIFNRLKVTRKQKMIIEEAHDELEEKNHEILDSITYAKRIQSAILPPLKVVKEYLEDSFILYKPKDIVAGDFYWMEHKEGKVLFAAADCTGHGVPGAMVSVVCNNALNRSVREHGLTDPGKILTKTRDIVIAEFEKSEEDVKDGMDIALCSLEGMKLQYAGAHNPLWIIRNREIIETKANKQPIGQFDNPEPYTTHSFDLEKGDSLYIFSDGYVDQFGGEKGKKFKARAFRDLLLSIQDKSMEVQKVIIDDTFETWKGSLDQIDDVCVIGVRV